MEQSLAGSVTFCEYPLARYAGFGGGEQCLLLLSQIACPPLRSSTLFASQPLRFRRSRASQSTTRRTARSDDLRCGGTDADRGNLSADCLCTPAGYRSSEDQCRSCDPARTGAWSTSCWRSGAFASSRRSGSRAPTSLRRSAPAECCWMPKRANALNNLPKSVQPEAKASIHET